MTAAHIPDSVFRGDTSFERGRFGAEVILAEAGFPTELETGPARRRSVRSGALPALLAADIVAIGVSLFAGQVIDFMANGHGTPGRAAATTGYVVVYLVCLSGYGLYARGRRRLVASSFPDFSRLAHSLLVASLVTVVISGPLHRWIGVPAISRTTITFAAFFALAGVPQTRAVARWAVLSRGGHSSRVLIVGSGMVASRVVARLGKVDGVTVVGCVDDTERPGTGGVDDVPVLGGLDAIPDLVTAQAVDHIVVAFSPVSGAKLAGVLRVLASEVQISIVPRLFDLLTVRSRVDELYGLPVVDVAPASLGPAARFAKRAMDIAASGAGLLVASPVMLAIAVAVKLTSPGPVLYSQERTGLGGRSFRIHKFRSMRVGAEAMRPHMANDVDGPLFKSRNDPRVTSIGRLLRKTSLDELPQLLNVLKGDMSLVGPRPFITSESEQIAGWAARRFDVRPGMTGLWQVSGRNDLPFDELCRLDHSYVASWSLWWDVRILWHTPAMVLRRRGAY